MGEASTSKATDNTGAYIYIYFFSNEIRFTVCRVLVANEKFINKMFYAIIQVCISSSEYPYNFEHICSLSRLQETYMLQKYAKNNTNDNNDNNDDLSQTPCQIAFDNVSTWYVWWYNDICIVTSINDLTKMP